MITGNPRPRFLLPFFAACIVTTAGFGQGACTEAWVPGVSPHGSPNAPIEVVKELDVGSGPQLFVLSSWLAFTRMGEVPVARLARFDGTAWTAVGTDSLTTISLKHGWDMTAYDTGSGPKLYVAGIFALPGVGAQQDCVARWDGSGWTIVGTMNAGDFVHGLTVFDDGTGPKLVAGGHFASVNGVAATSVASWNGAVWSPMAAITLGSTVKALEVIDVGAGPQLYARSASINPNPPLWRWNGAAWIAAGPANLQTVNSFCAHQEPGAAPALFVGGRIATGVGTTADAVLKWDGSTWTTICQVGPSTYNQVTALASCDLGSGQALYIGGSFQTVTAPGQPALTSMNLVRYSGNVLTAVAGATIQQPPNPVPYTLAAYHHAGATRLLAAASWTATSNLQRPTDVYPNYLAQFDGTSWSPIGWGSWYQRGAGALAWFDDGSGGKVYAAGRFRTLGGTDAQGLARWNGTSWEGIGAPSASAPQSPGARIIIRAMTVFDDGTGPHLYVAGSAGGYERVFRWNGGASFTQLGNEASGSFYIPYEVTSMVTWDDGTGPALWVSRRITGSGPGNYPTLLCWKNNAWQSVTDLGGIAGPNGGIEKLVVEPGPNGALILGGAFTSIGGATVYKIARLLPGYAIDVLGANDPLTILPSTPTVIDVARYDDGNGARIYALCRDFPAVSYSAPEVATIQRFDGPGWTQFRSLYGVTGGILRTVPYLGGHSLCLGTARALGPSSYVYALERIDGVSSTVFTVDGLPTDALAADDGGGPAHFFAGEFDTVGGVSSGNIAKLSSPWPMLLKQPAGQSVAPGQPIVLSLTVSSPSPATYQWFRESSPIPGATSATLSIPSATFADAGSYYVTVTNACISVASLRAAVAVRGCDLAIWQPFGPGALAIAQSGGPPMAHVFTALSANAANVTNPGEGSLFGLHLPLQDAVAQFVTQSPPFVTTLSASGSAFWASLIPPSLIGVTVWGVSQVYDPATLALIGSPSGVPHVTLQ